MPGARELRRYRSSSFFAGAVGSERLEFPFRLKLGFWLMNPHSGRTADSSVVLFVDRDIDTIRMYAEHLTSAASFVVDSASDGREALAKAVAHPPSAIVTETRLPGIDGYQLIELLRSDPATAAVPIIVLTGDAFPADMERAARSGADAVLPKPCLPDRLVTELRRMIALGHRLSEQSSQLARKAREEVARADRLVAQTERTMHRMASSRTFERHVTRNPPHPPPPLLCPRCERALTYLRSFVGGVSARFAEQWDEFDCPGGCGAYQYRQRTRKLRQAG